MPSYFEQCTGKELDVSLDAATEVTHPANILAVLADVDAAHVTDIIVGLVARCSHLMDTISKNAETKNALQTELNYVLADWNSLVAASGSRTNGGAVGYVARMREEVVALKKENAVLYSDLILMTTTHTD